LLKKTRTIELRFGGFMKMKKVWGFAMGLAIALMSTVLVTTAQDTPADPCADIDAATALYQTFVDNYNKKPLTVADREKAVKAGKEFLEKYGNCEAWKDQSNFVKPWVPKLEDWLVKMGRCFCRRQRNLCLDS
jgi:hypothetical protein